MYHLSLTQHLRHLKDKNYNTFHICLFAGLIFRLRYSLYQDTLYPTISEFLVADKEYTLANIYAIVVVGTDIYHNNEYFNIFTNLFLLGTASFHTSTFETQNMKNWSMIHNICVFSFVILKSWIAGNRRVWQFILHVLSFMPFIFINIWEKNLFQKEVEIIYDKYPLTPCEVEQKKYCS